MIGTNHERRRALAFKNLQRIQVQQKIQLHFGQYHLVLYFWIYFLQSALWCHPTKHLALLAAVEAKESVSRAMPRSYEQCAHKNKRVVARPCHSIRLLSFDGKRRGQCICSPTHLTAMALTLSAHIAVRHPLCAPP